MTIEIPVPDEPARFIPAVVVAGVLILLKVAAVVKARRPRWWSRTWAVLGTAEASCLYIVAATVLVSFVPDLVAASGQPPKWIDGNGQQYINEWYVLPWAGGIIVIVGSGINLFFQWFAPKKG